VDISARQLGTAHRMQDEFRLHFPLVQGDAEQMPLGTGCPPAAHLSGISRKIFDKYLAFFPNHIQPRARPASEGLRAYH
jgi:hypothetical protein